MLSVTGRGNLRKAMYVIGAVLVYSTVLFAQSVESSEKASTQYDVLKWAITQGGLVVVVLVILWSYRKDFKEVLGAQKAQIEIFASLVQQSTAAKVALIETNRQLVEEIRELRRERHG